MQVRVTGVEWTGDYSLDVRFSDGTSRRLDLRGLVYSRRALKSLRDPAVFRRAYVNEATHSVAWPGDIDINPDALYGAEQRRGIEVLAQTTDTARATLA